MRNLRQALPEVEFILLRGSDVPLPGWPDAAVVSDLTTALNLHPQMAVVASPSAAHIAVLPGLIAAGIPTYVEKPIVTSVDQVEIVRSALAKAPQCPNVAGFNLRLLPSISAARFAASTKLGQIVRASFTAGQWLPDWRKGQDHRQSYSAQRAAGGGVLFDLSHEFDAARLLLGRLDILATQTAIVDALDISSEGVAIVIMRSTAGTLASVTLDYVARRPVRRYELVGTHGTLVWDLMERSLTIADDAGVHGVLMPANAFDVAGTYTRAMRDFLNAVGSGRLGDLQSLEDGLESTELPIRAHGLQQH